MRKSKIKMNTSTFEWKGKALHPFSEGRRSLALSIGVRIFNPKVTEEQRNEGLLMDCHAILYLCAHSFETISIGHRQPDRIWSNIMEWSEQNVKQKDYQAEIELVGEILKDAFSERAQIVVEGGDDVAGE